MLRIVSGITIFLHLLLWLWIVSHKSSIEDTIAIFIGFGNYEFGWLTVPRGKAVDTGLKWLENKKVTPFEKIAKIRGYFTSGFPFNKLFHCVMTTIHSANGTRRKMFLTKSDLTRLAHSPLNRWVIGLDRFELMTDGSNSGLHLEYRPRGKYSPGWPLLIVYNFVIAFAALAFLTRLASVWTIMISLVSVFGFIWAMRSYRRVSVTLTPDGIRMQEKDVERYLPMDEIAGIDRRLFQLKVTSQNGEVYYFPKGCYLLAELIEEQVGWRNNTENMVPMQG